MVKNENGYINCKEVEDIKNHIEWNDYIDILGHWTNKPNWKDIIKSYRKQNIELFVDKIEFKK